MNTLLKFVIPTIRMADLPPMLGVAFAGGLIGGVYGIVHDQITYTISPEYFTKLKFHQFHYANFGLGNRFFAATVGFLATWSVGLIAAWFLARRFVPNQSRHVAYRQVCKGVACIFLFGMSFGVLGYMYGLLMGPEADLSSWQWAVDRFRIADARSFVRVAYIHNAGYLGGFAGLVFALVMIRPHRQE